MKKILICLQSLLLLSTSAFAAPITLNPLLVFNKGSDDEIYLVGWTEKSSDTITIYYPQFSVAKEIKEVLEVKKPMVFGSPLSDRSDMDQICSGLGYRNSEFKTGRSGSDVTTKMGMKAAKRDKWIWEPHDVLAMEVDNSDYMVTELTCSGKDS